MFKEQLKLLQNMPLFGGLSDASLELIIDASDIIPYDKGDYIYREGDSGNAMYVVIKGQFAVLKCHKQLTYEIASYGLGECLGIMEALNPSSRFCSIYATENAAAIRISSSDMLSLYHHDLEQYTLMQMNMGREVCRRMRRLEELLFKRETCLETHPIFKFPRGT